MQASRSAFLRVFTVIVGVGCFGCGNNGESPSSQDPSDEDPRMIASGGICEDPSWSPDGSKIVHQIHLSDPGGWSLRVADANNGEEILLVPLWIHDPSWSPDGSQIAFHWSNGEGMQIWVMPVEGGEATQITDFDRGGFSPCWSPDGTKLAYERGGSYGWHDIHTISSSGSNDVRITNSPSAADVSPAWSPDGSKIAFQSDRSGNTDIWVVSALGGVPQQLTTHPDRDEHPSWMPDGERIVFKSDRQETGHGLYIVNASGGEPSLLVSGIFGHPEVSPDGTEVVYMRSHAVWIEGLDGHLLLH